MSEEQKARSTESRRAYQPPKLVQYGDLRTLTRGMPHPGAGPQDNFGKLIGAGDDLSSFLPGSPFVVRPQ